MIHVIPPAALILAVSVVDAVFMVRIEKSILSERYLGGAHVERFFDFHFANRLFDGRFVIRAHGEGTCRDLDETKL